MELLVNPVFALDVWYSGLWVRPGKEWWRQTVYYKDSGNGWNLLTFQQDFSDKWVGMRVGETSAERKLLYAAPVPLEKSEELNKLYCTSSGSTKSHWVSDGEKSRQW